MHHALADPETSKGGPTSPADPRPGREAATLAAKRPHLRLEGLGERLSSPSESGRSPAAKRFFMDLWPENEDWERLNSLNRYLAELGAKHAF